jgi:hypothetical protein
MTDNLIPYAKFFEIRERRRRVAADLSRPSSQAIVVGGHAPELPLTLDCVGISEPRAETGEELPPDHVDTHGGRFQGIGGAVSRPSRAIVDL